MESLGETLGQPCMLRPREPRMSNGVVRGMGMIGVGVNGTGERKDSEMERVWVISKDERVKESVWLV